MDKIIVIILLIILATIALYELISLTKECFEERKARQEHERIIQQLDTLEMLGVPAYSMLFFLDE